MSNNISLPYHIINNILSRIKVKRLIGDDILDGYIIKHLVGPYNILLYALIKKKRYKSVVLYLQYNKVELHKSIDNFTALNCILCCISNNVEFAEYLFKVFKHNLCSITNITFTSIIRKLIYVKCHPNELQSFLHQICDWGIDNNKYIQLPLFITFNIFKHKYCVKIFDILLKKKHCILYPLLSLDINDINYTKCILVIIHKKVYNLFKVITKQQSLSHGFFQLCLASKDLTIIRIIVKRYKPRFYSRNLIHILYKTYNKNLNIFRILRPKICAMDKKLTCYL
jgi:hypothetical protein